MKEHDPDQDRLRGALRRTADAARHARECADRLDSAVQRRVTIANRIKADRILEAVGQVVRRLDAEAAALAGDTGPPEPWQLPLLLPATDPPPTSLLARRERADVRNALHATQHAADEAAAIAKRLEDAAYDRAGRLYPSLESLEAWPECARAGQVSHEIMLLARVQWALQDVTPALHPQSRPLTGAVSRLLERTRDLLHPITNRHHQPRVSRGQDRPTPGAAPGARPREPDLGA